MLDAREILKTKRGTEGVEGEGQNSPSGKERNGL